MTDKILTCSHMNVSELIAWTRRKFSQSDIDKDTSEQVLNRLCHFFLGMKIHRVLKDEADIDEQHLAAFQEAVLLYTQEHFPVAYLTGQGQFKGLDFFISAQPQEAYHSGKAWGKDIYKTYVPREETEWIVQKVEQVIQNASLKHPRIVDIATGSGCIAVTLQKVYPEAKVTAVEVSPQAIRVAERNNTFHHTDVRLLKGSWFEPVLGEQFDIVICNPPYVPKGQEEKLSTGAQHEPEQAHYAEEEPEALYKLLFQQARTVLAPKGFYIFEIGFGQFGNIDVDIVAIADSNDLTAEIQLDKEGISRFVHGTMKANANL